MKQFSVVLFLALTAKWPSPGSKQGYDAMVTMWVTKEMFDRGFEAQLYQDGKQWIATVSPFAKVAYPGKEMSNADWGKLPDKK